MNLRLAVERSRRADQEWHVSGAWIASELTSQVAAAPIRKLVVENDQLGRPAGKRCAQVMQSAEPAGVPAHVVRNLAHELQRCLVVIDNEQQRRGIIPERFTCHHGNLSATGVPGTAARYTRA